jgi:glycerophosphoryl diester phosphodiesterase
MYSGFFLKNESPSVQNFSFKNTRFVAHAGGALFDSDGNMLTYTNSREAVILNYGKGHRVFEIDFGLTSDGKLVAVHDWESGAKILNWGGDVPALEDFKGLKIHEKYTTMSIDDVVKLMNEYKDMYIVTDTKEMDKNLIIQEFAEIYRAAENVDINILDRIIPQIYYPKMLETIYEVYPFQNVIYTLYMSLQNDFEVVNFVKEHPSIKAITMLGNRATEEFVSRLDDIGLFVYCHTINEFNEAIRLMNIGVHGLYTDYLY